LKSDMDRCLPVDAVLALSVVIALTDLIN